MKKKLLTVIMVATMLVAATGCGSTKDEAVNEPSTSENEVVTTEDALNDEAIDADEANTDSETNTDDASIEDTASDDEASADSNDDVVVRVGAMSGPTAMSLVKLMEDSEEGTTKNSYEFAELTTDAASLVAPISQGELDIAAIPSNLASNLYNKTEGGVMVLATVNTGVLFVVERGDDIETINDLEGQTVYMTGQGAVPEFTVRYLLAQNGLDADNDLTIQWCADTTEALSYVTNDESAVAILPQPFVTAACAQVEGLHVAIDLNDEWEKLDNGCSIITGVIVARTEFVDSYPEVVSDFITEYEASVNYTSEDVDGAAALIEKYGIVAKAPVAKMALPGCHLTCLTKEEMKTAVSGFLQILFEQKPESVGGAMPEDNFYYNE